MSATHPIVWAHKGSCRTMDPALFFPGREGATPEAAAACVRCPVATECREWALHHESHGFWAGMSAKRLAQGVLDFGAAG